MFFGHYQSFWSPRSSLVILDPINPAFAGYELISLSLSCLVPEIIWGKVVKFLYEHKPELQDLIMFLMIFISSFYQCRSDRLYHFYSLQILYFLGRGGGEASSYHSDAVGSFFLSWAKHISHETQMQRNAPVHSPHVCSIAKWGKPCKIIMEPICKLSNAGMLQWYVYGKWWFGRKGKHVVVHLIYPSTSAACLSETGSIRWPTWTITCFYCLSLLLTHSLAI